ncbi:MAG: single-stranded DNA-binding protein [Lentisphaeria bacterium]|nr:single-stranded DNA-binding protein [Lentisphaeria bacterium]
MLNLNSITLSGNLSRDPELRVAGETPVCNFAIANNRKWKSDGELKEEVTFIDVTVWGKQAETCNLQLRKGSPVVVEGRIKMEKWEDAATGLNRSKILITAERVQFLSVAPAEAAQETAEANA